MLKMLATTADTTTDTIVGDGWKVMAKINSESRNI